MADIWLQDYKKAQEQVKQVAAEIKKRGNAEAGSVGRSTALIRGQMSQLSQQVSHLSSTLENMRANPSGYNITAKEVSRRSDLVSQLEEQRGELQSAYQQGFLNGNGSSSSGMTQQEREKSREEMRGMSDASLGVHQTQLIREQDEQLGFLEGTVANLKQIGHNISEEVDVHIRLLGDLDRDIDSTQGKLKGNQRMLDKLMHKTSNTCLVFIIVLLIINLIAMLVFL